MTIDPPTLRLAAFAVGLLAAFGAAFGLGRAAGPLGDDGHPAARRPPATTSTGPTTTTSPGGFDHGSHP
jgi:hypothetical protein